MAHPNRSDCALPLPLPSQRREQVLLMMLRRMAIHGLHDAHASMLALDHFGGGFLRTLHLVRAFLHGLSRHAAIRIQVAPCCAPRMTRHEGLVISAMVHGCPVALIELTRPAGYGDLRTLSQALQTELGLQ